MEGGMNRELSKYRYERAMEDLEMAKAMLEKGGYRASVNRSYYAIFHGLRAVTIMGMFDSSKHSGVIAFFNQHYVKEGIFDREVSKIITSAYRLREKADYEDFAVVSKKEAEEQYKKAEMVLETIKNYLSDKWEDG